MEVAVLCGILLAAVGMWIFVSLASEVMEGDTTRFDEHLLLALRRPDNPALPLGPVWLLQVARDVTAFGGATGLGAVTLVVCGYLWLQRRLGLLTFVFASVFSGTTLALVIKEFFHRPRPQLVPHLTDISTASFPSGHSMLSSVTYLTLAALLARSMPGFRIKLYFLFVAVVLTLSIGVSRVYLGVHYPTDVLAGWCLGCVWATICCLTAHFIASRRLVPEAGELSDASAPEAARPQS